MTETIALCDYPEKQEKFQEILSWECTDKNVKKREVPEKLSLVHLTYSNENILGEENLKKKISYSFIERYNKIFRDYLVNEKKAKTKIIDFYNPFKKDFWDKENLFAKHPLIGNLLINTALIRMDSDATMFLVPSVVTGFLGSELFRGFKNRYFLKKAKENEHIVSYVEKIISLDDSDVKSICVPKAQKRVKAFESNISKLTNRVLPNYKTIHKDLEKIYSDYFQKIA
jgi:hypothetical protein